MIDRTLVYRGTGTIKANGTQIGKADSLNLIFQAVGLEQTNEKNSCYGVITGSITEKSLIPQWNIHKETDAELEAKIEPAKGGQPLWIVVKKITFINDIPHDGTLDSEEFHGESEVLASK
ncbi:Uncharacterised protein [uncultured archaeon]|nr:Uncharacterised protein [uncultured archaeon]